MGVTELRFQGTAGIAALFLLLIIASSCAKLDAVQPKVGDKGEFEAEPVSELPDVQEEPFQPAPSQEQDVENSSVNGKKGTTWKVTLKDFKLMPRTLSISAGDTVVWLNEDERRGRPLDHLLASHFEEFRSPVFTKGQNFSHTFSVSGTYTYFDILYKSRDLLEGTISVK